MRRAIVARRIVQGVAVCYGILSIALVLAGIGFIAFAIRDREWVMMGFVLFSLLGPAGFMILAAYQNLRRFGEKSIKSISTVVALTFWLLVFRWLEPYLKPDAKSALKLYYPLIVSIIPLMVAFVVYQALSKILIRITRRDSPLPPTLDHRPLPTTEEGERT